jgi:cytidylate kinase
LSVITVSRQYASGGSAIAKQVADRLRWTIVDHEFVDRVSERIGLPPDEVAQREERVASLIERLANTLAVSSPELFLAAGDLAPEATRSSDDIVRMTEAVIQEAAELGNVVLVGRGAQAYLAHGDDTLHVRIVAPREVRIRNAAQRLGLGEREAERTVDRRDNERRDYVRTHYQRDWDDSCNYHLVVNSALMSYEGAADLIVGAAKRICEPFL